MVRTTRIDKNEKREIVRGEIKIAESVNVEKEKGIGEVREGEASGKETENCTKIEKDIRTTSKTRRNRQVFIKLICQTVTIKLFRNPKYL